LVVDTKKGEEATGVPNTTPDHQRRIGDT